MKFESGQTVWHQGQRIKIIRQIEDPQTIPEVSPVYEVLSSSGAIFRLPECEIEAESPVQITQSILGVHLIQDSDLVNIESRTTAFRLIESLQKMLRDGNEDLPSTCGVAFHRQLAYKGDSFCAACGWYLR